MKKLSILLIVFILVAGFVFAQEQTQQAEEQPAQPEPPKTEFFNLEVTIGFPVHWTTGLHNDEFYPNLNGWQEDRFVTANTAIGVALNFNFTRVLGLVLDFDFFYSAKINGVSPATSDYLAMSGMNLFFGPVFYLFNNNILRIPLAVGAHMYYYNDDVWVPYYYTDSGATDGAWMNRSELQFGIGSYLGVQFHFNRDIYIFSRVNVSIDLFRMHSMKGHNVTDNYGIDPTVDCTDVLDIHWGVKPAIGIGIKF